jgi:hypothetical protein
MSSSDTKGDTGSKYSKKNVENGKKWEESTRLRTPNPMETMK